MKRGKHRGCHRKVQRKGHTAEGMILQHAGGYGTKGCQALEKEIPPIRSSPSFAAAKTDDCYPICRDRKPLKIREQSFLEMPLSQTGSSNNGMHGVLRGQ